MSIPGSCQIDNGLHPWNHFSFSVFSLDVSYADSELVEKRFQAVSVLLASELELANNMA